MKNTTTDMIRYQQALGAMDEEIAMKCDPPMSKSTIRLALRGKGTVASTMKAKHALEAVRLDKIEKLTKLGNLAG